MQARTGARSPRAARRSRPSDVPANQLHGRREDAQLAALGVVDEDRLAEPEVRRHAWRAAPGTSGAVEEHRQRVAAGSVLAAEHAQEMQLAAAGAQGSLLFVDQMELRNRLVMATQMWREATGAPLPRMPPGNPVEQLQAFELKLVDMLWSRPRRRRRGTSRTRPGTWSTTAATTTRSSAGSSSATRRSPASRPGVGDSSPDDVTREDLPELFDLRVKARSLAYLFTAGAASGCSRWSSRTTRTFRDLQLWIASAVAVAIAGVSSGAPTEITSDWQIHVALGAGHDADQLRQLLRGHVGALPAPLHLGRAVRLLLLHPPRSALAHLAYIGVALRRRARDPATPPSPASAGCWWWARRWSPAC